MFFFRTNFMKDLKFKILFNVLRGCFFLAPRVDSAVINLKKKSLNSGVEDEEFFLRCLELVFLKNNKFKIKA